MAEQSVERKLVEEAVIAQENRLRRAEFIIEHGREPNALELSELAAAPPSWVTERRQGVAPVEISMDEEPFDPPKDFSQNSVPVAPYETPDGPGSSLEAEDFAMAALESARKYQSGEIKPGLITADFLLAYGAVWAQIAVARAQREQTGFQAGPPPIYRLHGDTQQLERLS